MAKKRRRKPVKAYRNQDFLASPDARIIRIMAEFIEPLRRFKHQAVSDTIVFFGSGLRVSSWIGSLTLFCCHGVWRLQ